MRIKRASSLLMKAAPHVSRKTILFFFFIYLGDTAAPTETRPGRTAGGRVQRHGERRRAGRRRTAVRPGRRTGPARSAPVALHDVAATRTVHDHAPQGAQPPRQHQRRRRPTRGATLCFSFLLFLCVRVPCVSQQKKNNNNNAPSRGAIGRLTKSARVFRFTTIQSSLCYLMNEKKLQHYHLVVNAS